MRKTANIHIPTKPVSRATEVTGFTFKSYDKNAGVLRFEIKNQDGSPTDLLGATVRLFMYIYQAEEKKEFPIFENQIITESYMQGIVKYSIPDMLLSYEGKVDANIYIDFPDGSHTDNLAFTFNIEKSVIDGDVQLNGEYYFKDFKQLLEGVEQEATDAVNTALENVDKTIQTANEKINNFVTRATEDIEETVEEVTVQLQETKDEIDNISKNTASLQDDLTVLEGKMNETNQQLGDLGNLKRMYSNSIDFGNYDYSGNPNLLPPVSAQNFTLGTGGTATDGDEGEIIFTLDGSNTFIRHNTTLRMPAVLPGETYTISAEIKFHSGIVGDVSNLRFTLNYLPGGAVSLETARPIEDTSRDKWIQISRTQIPNFSTTPPTQWYLALQDVVTANRITGTISLRKLKIEKGSTVTPIQPNLLLAPYEISKVTLKPNLADKSKIFPITTSNYLVYDSKREGRWELGKTYTISIKGTKPNVQRFDIYLGAGTIRVGDMKPVEGLSDTWQMTFTITEANVNAGAVDILRVYQHPSTSVGNCVIEWLKLEEGDTATPNILQYKYFGEGLKDSNNPYDYSWDITPEHTETELNDSVTLSDPQEVPALKNFTGGLQTEGKEVATKEDTREITYSGTATVPTDLTNNISEIVYVFRRKGSIVTFFARVNVTSANELTSLPNILALRNGFKMSQEISTGVRMVPIDVQPLYLHETNRRDCAALVEGTNLRFGSLRGGNHYLSGVWLTDDDWPEN
ncbi:BppU family phage baseplate upper protein [Enterococcus mundtii]|uniref:BppU family phage baseplate upper protein n=1 Tax=Enterococcus mundtii TaxID=53346 RepID=UPI0013767A32|nr:BppU family phage baseplate upper protein [Enterococcus mundtii]NBA63278.1 BppU family phage baseplate upper protein [Enterococcus mundtii]